MSTIIHHHHHVALPARISLTLSRHFSLSFIASGKSSGLHPVSSHSCCMYVRAGRPTLAHPYVGVHWRTSLMSSSLLLQQCPACLVRRTSAEYIWQLVFSNTFNHILLTKLAKIEGYLNKHYFSCPHQKKSNGIKPSDHGGRRNGLPFQTHLRKNFSWINCPTRWATWLGIKSYSSSVFSISSKWQSEE